jgi:hypothetical protein
MIEAIAEASRGFLDAPKASRQKKDALFELACRVALVAQESRFSDKAIDKAVASERRKLLKAALAMVANGASSEDIASAMAPVPKSGGQGDDDPGIELERAMVDSGCRALANNEHYSVVMRRMTAFLGPEYFDKAEAWLTERSKRRKARAESLVVPGELPDVIRILAMDKRNLERALRASGRDIAAAALAGCPQESMDLARPLYGKIGAAALEDEAAHQRARLSGDEIAQAQAAFLEVLRNLEERGELRLGPEEELSADPAFVAALTRAVLGLDAAVIKGAFRQAEGALVATAMQGMEPQAHDRILEVLSKKEMKRILDAIDDTDPLPRHAVQGAGRELAERLFEAAGAAKAPKAALEKLAIVRDWEGA